MGRQGIHHVHTGLFSFILCSGGAAGILADVAVARIRLHEHAETGTQRLADTASPVTVCCITRPCRLEPLRQRGEDRWRELQDRILPILGAGFQFHGQVFRAHARHEFFSGRVRESVDTRE